MRRLLTAAVAAASLVAVPLGLAGGSDRHDGRDRDRTRTYAVIGDTPYGDPQLANFPSDVAEINAHPEVRLTLHVGDIKNGSSRCDTNYFQQVRNGFDLFERPLVYTPGDNEWTDCHRANNGAYNAIERLATLRTMFFPHPGRTLGQQSRAVRAQRDFPENVLWSDGRVEFGMVHVVGSNNGWALETNATTQSAAQIGEYTARNAASLVWLDRIFDRADENHAKAIVIGIQADMWDPFFVGPNNLPAGYDRFTDFVQRLAELSREFERPVLLINGDSHIFNDERPLADATKPYLKGMYGVTADVPNLRRVTTNGSTTPCHEWIKLHVDTRSKDVFTIERVLFRNQPGFTSAVCPAR